MYSITIIKVDGTMERSEQEAVPDYRLLRNAVGGSLETVPYFDTFEGQPCVAYCDEEGKLKEKPINERASLLWYGQLEGFVDDVLAGDIIIIAASQEELAAL